MLSSVLALPGLEGSERKAEEDVSVEQSQPGDCEPQAGAWRGDSALSLCLSFPMVTGGFTCSAQSWEGLHRSRTLWVSL